MPTLGADNKIIVTPEDIRAAFPEFSDAEQFPDAMIQNNITQAGCYVSTVNYGDIDFDCRALMIELVSCHLIALSKAMADAAAGSGTTGGVVGQISRATIGDVTVSVAVPANKNELQYWMNQTPYGQRYLALVSAKVSPLYYGGSWQRVL